MTMAAGSILTFIVMNAVVGSSPSAKLILPQRLFVSAISKYLTMPGALMLLAAACLKAVVERGHVPADEWLLAELAVSILIVANTLLLITPLARKVTAIAEIGAAEGEPPPSYKPLKRLEDRCGAGNLLLLVAAFLIGVLHR